MDLVILYVTKQKILLENYKFDNEHFLNYCFPEDLMVLILNGYRKRAVCRKHKVEAGNWSFDPNQGSCNQPFSILISSQLFINIQSIHLNINICFGYLNS